MVLVSPCGLPSSPAVHEGGNLPIFQKNPWVQTLLVCVYVGVMCVYACARVRVLHNRPLSPSPPTPTHTPTHIDTPIPTPLSLPCPALPCPQCMMWDLGITPHQLVRLGGPLGKQLVGSFVCKRYQGSVAGEVRVYVRVYSHATLRYGYRRLRYSHDNSPLVESQREPGHAHTLIHPTTHYLPPARHTHTHTHTHTHRSFKRSLITCTRSIHRSALLSTA